MGPVYQCVKLAEHTTYPSIKLLQNLTVTEADVAKRLASLDVRKASGNDGIPTKLLKAVAYEIAPSLCSLFRLSVNCSISAKMERSDSDVGVQEAWILSEIHQLQADISTERDVKSFRGDRLYSLATPKQPIQLSAK